MRMSNNVLCVCVNKRFSDHTCVYQTANKHQRETDPKSFSNSCKDKRISSFQRQSSCIQKPQMRKSMHIDVIHRGRDIKAEIYLRARSRQPSRCRHCQQAATVITAFSTSDSQKKIKNRVNTSLEFLQFFSSW